MHIYVSWYCDSFILISFYVAFNFFLYFFSYLEKVKCWMSFTCLNRAKIVFIEKVCLLGDLSVLQIDSRDLLYYGRLKLVYVSLHNESNFTLLFCI